jgi:putative redox protein
MAVAIDVTYRGGLHCEALHVPSGQTFWTDAPLDNGGRGESFSPTDLVATALGSCLLTIIGLVAERHALSLDGVRVRVEKTMAAAPLRRIAELRSRITFPASVAASLEPAVRDKLERAASHCPVHASLHPEIEAPIEFVYETLETSA